MFKDCISKRSIQISSIPKKESLDRGIAQSLLGWTSCKNTSWFTLCILHFVHILYCLRLLLLILPIEVLNTASSYIFLFVRDNYHLIHPYKVIWPTFGSNKCVTHLSNTLYCLIFYFIDLSDWRNLHCLFWPFAHCILGTCSLLSSHICCIFFG